MAGVSFEIKYSIPVCTHAGDSEFNLHVRHFGQHIKAPGKLIADSFREQACLPLGYQHATCALPLSQVRSLHVYQLVNALTLLLKNAPGKSRWRKLREVLQYLCGRLVTIVLTIVIVQIIPVLPANTTGLGFNLDEKILFSLV